MPIVTKRGGADMRPSLLPPEILPLFDDAFVRSCDLFEEYIFRLTLDVFRETGLQPVCWKPVTTDEAIARAELDPGASRVPLDWIFRELAARGVLQTGGEGSAVRYRLPGDLPGLGAAAVRDAQERHDPSALPSYAIASLAAAHYPAVLRGETTGDKVLFGPDRIGTWSDYFSNANVLYAISNVIAPSPAMRPSRKEAARSSSWAAASEAARRPCCLACDRRVARAR